MSGGDKCSLHACACPATSTALRTRAPLTTPWLFDGCHPCDANIGTHCLVMMRMDSKCQPFRFTERGLAALVMSTTPSGQWHEMIDAFVSQLCMCGQSDSSTCPITQEPSQSRRALVGVAASSVTDGLAIAFLKSVSVHCVCTCVSCNRCRAHASYAMCRCAAIFPNPPTESTHRCCPHHILGDIAGLLLSRLQLKSTCYDNVCRRRCLHCRARLHLQVVSHTDTALLLVKPQRCLVGARETGLILDY